MNKNLNSIAQYVDSISQNARELIAATSDVAEENVRSARKRLSSAVNSGSEVYDRVRGEARDKARCAGETVRENPVATAAIILVVAGLIALLLTRRND